MALVSRWPKPDGGPEAFAINPVDGCEPKNLVGRFRNDRANVFEAPFRVRYCQNPKLLLAESLLEFAGNSQLEIICGLLLPN